MLASWQNLSERRADAIKQFLTDKYGIAGSNLVTYSDPSVPFDPFNASIASGTDRTNLAKIGAQWTHLFGSSVEGNLNGGFVQSFANHSGLVATVTDDGLVAPSIGNQYWFEYGGRIGYRITKGWIADLFVDGTLGPQPVGNTIHGGAGLRLNY